MPENCQAMSVAMGKRIRELRKIRGWTQLDLARRLGSHREIVARVERGQHVSSMDTILRYAQAFGVTPDLITEVVDEEQLLENS